MQAKAYARANGIPNVKHEMDRSRVTTHAYDYYFDYDECRDKYSDSSLLLTPEILILCIFLLSNLLLLSFTILYFRKMFLWLQQQGKQTETLYKASATVLTCVNVILLVLDMAFIVHDNINDITILAPILGIKAPPVLFILILETPIVCFNTYYRLNLNNEVTINKKWYRIAHAFALCQIIWFMHRLVTDAIISIIFFVVFPAQTLGVVTLVLLVIASAVAFVAIIIYIGFKRKTCTSLFCVALNGIMICGLLVVITLLYIEFVNNGLKSAGIGGFILSLVPPLAVFVIGYTANQKYKSTHSTTSVDATMELQGTNENRAIQIDDGETETSQLLQLMRSRYSNKT